MQSRLSEREAPSGSFGRPGSWDVQKHSFRGSKGQCQPLSNTRTASHPRIDTLTASFLRRARAPVASPIWRTWEARRARLAGSTNTGAAGRAGSPCASFSGQSRMRSYWGDCVGSWPSPSCAMCLITERVQAPGEMDLVANQSMAGGCYSPERGQELAAPSLPLSILGSPERL
jgi:hypothetical protein